MRRALLAATILIFAGLILPSESIARSPPPQSCLERTPIDLMLVMDRSGSMLGQPLADSKNAANTLLAALEPTDHSGLVSYSGSATLDKGLTATHTGPSDPTSTEYAVNAMTAGGGTSIAAGITTAHQHMNAHNHGYERVMVVLSDGVSNYGATQAAATAAKNQNITLYTIGYGNNINHAELRDAATSPRHYSNPTNAQELQAVIQDIINQFKGKSEAFADAYNLYIQITDPTLGTVEEIDKLHYVQAPSDQQEGLVDVRVDIPNTRYRLEATLVRSYASASPGHWFSDAHARAEVQDLRISEDDMTPWIPDPILFRASTIRSEIVASHSSAGGGAWADSEVLGVEIDGEKVQAQGQTVQTNFGSVRFGSDTLNASDHSAEREINAIELTLEVPETGQTVEVIVSHAHAAVLCGRGEIGDPDPPTDEPEPPCQPPDLPEMDLGDLALIGSSHLPYHVGGPVIGDPGDGQPGPGDCDVDDPGDPCTVFDRHYTVGCRTPGLPEINGLN